MFTDTVGKPAIEKRFVGRATFGEFDIARALERLDRLEQHILATCAARMQEGFERGQGARPDRPVDGEVAVVATLAVEPRGRGSRDPGG